MAHNRSNRLQILFLIALLSTLSFCAPTGSENNTQKTYKAPIISTSLSRGVIFSAKSIDQSLPNTSIYFYDFQKGLVTELNSGERKDPAIFQLSKNEVAIISRDQNPPSYQLVNLNGDILVSKVSLEGLTTGDPFDAAVIGSSSEYVVLTGSTAGALYLMKKNSGAILQVVKENWQFPPASTLRPLGLYAASASQIFFIHHGVSYRGVVPTVNQSQKIFKSTLSGDKLVAADLTGKKIYATNAARFFQAKDSSPVVFGMCTQQLGSDCKAGAQVFDASSMNLKTVGSFDSFGFDDYNQSSSYCQNQILSQVKSNTSGSYLLGKINVESSTLTQIYEFSDERPYASFCESEFTFFGTIEEGIGKLLVFKGTDKIGSVELYKAPYSGAVVQ